MESFEITMRMVRQLTVTASHAHAHGDRAASKAGQSLARWQVLDSFTETPLTVPSAARRLGQSRQSAQRIVDLLVVEGLLDALPNPDHRKSPLYSVTDKGRATLESLSKSVIHWHRFINERMTSDELTALSALLLKLDTVANDYQPPV